MNHIKNNLPVAVILSRDQIDAIDALVSYLYEDEAKHYEEMDRPSGHIFKSVLAVKRLLKKIKK